MVVGIAVNFRRRTIMRVEFVSEKCRNLHLLDQVSRYLWSIYNKIWINIINKQLKNYELGVQKWYMVEKIFYINKQFLGTAEIRFWRCDTVFCWSESSPLKIKNTGNFKLVFNASPVGDKKTPKLRAKTENLAPELRLSFLFFVFHIIYCARVKLSLHSMWNCCLA